MYPRLYLGMKRLHRLSGILFGFFVAVHLANHAVSLLGPSQHLALMNGLRAVYRQPVVETVLLLLISWQIGSGLGLFVRPALTARTPTDQWQRWSGLYIAGFLIIHLSAVFTGRYVLYLDTNLYFGAAGLNTFPYLLFFVPYYGFAILAVFVHIAAVHQKKMTRAVLGLAPRQQARLIVALGTLLTVAIVYGLTNGFRGLRIPAEFGVMVGK